MNKWTVIGAAVLGSLAVSALLVGLGSGHHAAPEGAQGTGAGVGAGLGSWVAEPWFIEALPEGRSRILAKASHSGGLVLGGTMQQQPPTSTLAEVQRLWPSTSQIAVVAAPGEDGALEAYVDPASLGSVAGKLVASTQLPADTLRQWRERAIKSEFMESSTRKYTLAEADLATALRTPIGTVTFIPQARLDEATVIERFGPPAQRLTGEGDTLHLLYPAKGLDVAISPKGKSVLQYVAPAAFEQLRAPLLKQGQAANAKPSS
jgi:hypothetical protein